MDAVVAKQMDALATQYKALEALVTAEHARLCEAPEAARPAIEAAISEHHGGMEAAASAVLDALLGPGGSGRPAA